VARIGLVLGALGCLTALTVAVERESAAADPARAETLTRAGRAALEQATEAGHWEAIRSFQAALVADPGHASAEAGMADAYVLLYLHVRPKPEYRADATRHAARAVELAPNSSAAHTSRAQVLGLDFDLTAARREAELALQVDPRNTLARQVYAGTLMSLGQVEPGLAQIARAAADDPGSAMRQGLASRLHQVARHYDEAIRYGVRAQQLNPNLPSFFRMSLAYSYWAKQRHPEAVEALLLDPALTSNQKTALRTVGQEHGVRAVVKQLYAAQVARSGKPCTDIPSIAGTVLAFLEEPAQALDCLALSFREGVPPGFLELDPVLDPLRKDPRFARLVAQRPKR
jgi:tetratricopeptide (TPR) repeat protein